MFRLAPWLLWLALAPTAVAQDAEYEASATIPSETPGEGRSRSRVTRTQLEERMPRSAPDALRYEPGVYVQQTAHGQASPFVRGLTGQQVVHLFDGVRLNNGIYRQGPNQYFFTVDWLTLSALDVVRGSASTRYGSDAIGGAVLATSNEPVPTEGEGFRLEERVFGRFGSADLEVGGRGELLARIGDRFAVRVGGGYRRAGRLTSGGVVQREGFPAPLVPRFEDDGKTQLGTGFREGTFDAHMVYAITPRLRATAALYGYRQYDAPRTDQCPPPEAPESECLWIREQFRTLAYASLRGDAGRDIEDLELILSFQQHHERRERDRPRSLVRLDFLDVVDTLGFDLRAATRRFSLGDERHLRFRYGLSGYSDRVASDSSQTFTDIDRTLDLSRGQYIGSSGYVSLGAFTEAEVRVLPMLFARVGGRLSVIGASAPGDPESGTRSVAQTYTSAVGKAGLELVPQDGVSFSLNVDQGFRAPNLDDLTSRQQVGPGFQFENPDLIPETSTTYELGAQVDLDVVSFSAFGFAIVIDDAITRALRDESDCPPATPQCASSRVHFQLVNTVGASYVLGTEGGATLYLPEHFTLRGTASYAYSDAPRLRDATSDTPDRVPLSRTPPLNGTVELRYRHIETGLYAAAALRWALLADRLSPSDMRDRRIPRGGTPGYAVFDLRAGIRHSDWLRVALVVENLFDRAYRVHGSSINGAGLSLTLGVEVSHR